MTMRYITSELEEIEREENFRLKRFKQLKMKRLGAGMMPNRLVIKKVEIADAQMKEEKIGDEKIEDIKVVTKKIEDEVIKDEEIKDDKLIEPLTEKYSYVIPEPQPDKQIMSHTGMCACCLCLFDVTDKTDQFLCPLCQLEADAIEDDLRLDIVPCKTAYTGTYETERRLENLMTQVVELAEQYKSGTTSPCLDNFIKTCSSINEKINITNDPLQCDCFNNDEEQPDAKLVLSCRTSVHSTPLSVHPSSVRDRPTEEPSATFKLTPVPDPKLGYYEKKFKEIVKVTRLKNPDGTICEEKQVITIKTERRNPRSADGNDGDFNEPKYIGTCTTSGSGYVGNTNTNGKISESTHLYDTTNKHGSCAVRGSASTVCGDAARKSTSTLYAGAVRESCSTVCGSARPVSGSESQHFGYGGTASQVCAPTKTKSESLNRSPAWGEPNVRPCMSADYQNYGKNDASTGTDGKCSCYGTSKTRFSSEKLKPPLEKVSEVTSVDSQLCGLERSGFVCSTELDTCIIKPSTKNLSTCTSAQTCWNYVLERKSTADKATSCIPNCGTPTSRPATTIENKSINTESIRRECCTSTTCLQRVNKKKPIKTPSPTPSCNSRNSKRKGRMSNSSCTIKIISKPPKVCNFDKKDEDGEIILKGSMLSALRKMILPSCKSTQCDRIEQEFKNVCPLCMSLLVKASSSQKSEEKSQFNPSCSTCRAKRDVEREEEFVKEDVCSSCGTLGYSSLSAETTRSTAAGSTSTPATGSSVTASSSICYPKYSLSKKSSGTSTCTDSKQTCSLSQTLKSSRSSCPTSKLGQDSDLKNRVWTRPDSKPSTRDVTTSTKRSDRFDCRPLKSFLKLHVCEKIRSETCACHSDTHFLIERSQCRTAVPRSQSCCDEFYFFRR